MFVDVAYGIEARREDDEFIAVSERALRGLEKCDNKSIIDIFPWGMYVIPSWSCYCCSCCNSYLRNGDMTVQHIPSWIPGMRWKRSIDILKTYVLQMVDAPYERVKEGLVGHIFYSLSSL